MERIRVVVVGSRLLRDLIGEIAANQPDVEVIEDVGQATVLVCAEEDEDVSSRLEELLYKHPRLRIILIPESRGGSVQIELRPQRRPLGELGPDGLLAAIRDGASH